MKKVIFGLFLASLTGICHAYEDARVVTEAYDANKIYNVWARVGEATLIQFENGEALTSTSSVLGMGRPDDWDVGVRGSSIMIRPWVLKNATNLIVVTNKRTYAFELMTATKEISPTFVMRFTYPEEERKRKAAEAAAIAERVKISAASKAEKISINTDYSWRGEAKDLVPTGAYDDGRFTRLIYDNGADLPSFYDVKADGSEALMNTNIDQHDRRVVMLDSVIKKIRARYNNEVIEIINNSYKPTKFNKYGTGVHGAVRIEKQTDDGANNE